MQGGRGGGEGEEHAVRGGESGKRSDSLSGLSVAMVVMTCVVLMCSSLSYNTMFVFVPSAHPLHMSLHPTASSPYNSLSSYARSMRLQAARRCKDGTVS